MGLYVTAVYPAGSHVLTSQGETAVVLSQNKEFQDRPIIKIIKDYNKIIDCDETKFDINRTDISQIENQKLLLKDFEIVALCKVLNISYEQLFENTDNIFD